MKYLTFLAKKKKKKKAHYGLMIWLKLMGEAQDGKLGVVGR